MGYAGENETIVLRSKFEYILEISNFNPTSNWGKKESCKRFMLSSNYKILIYRKPLATRIDLKDIGENRNKHEFTPLANFPTPLKNIKLVNSIVH